MIQSDALFTRIKGVRPVLLAAAVVLAGCGGGGGGSSSGGSTGGGDTGVGEISANASAIDFGDIVIDSTSARSFTITNTGTASFPVGNSDPGGPFAVDRPCDSLAPNESCTIVVQFSPQTQGTFTSSFDIGSQEINTTINVSGEGNGLSVAISSVEQACPDPALSVRVRVSDPAGEPVSGLAGTHFTTLIDGSEVAPDSFDTVNIDEPVTVGLMIDWSTSLESFRQDLIDGSKLFINSLRDTDAAGLYRFATAVDLNALDFVTTDATGKQQLIDALENTAFDGSQSPTLLWDSVSDVLGRVENQASDNRVLVLLTDGFDDDSTATLDEVISDATANNVTVFTIGFGDIEFEVLERLADETGGLFFPSPDLSDLGTIYDTLLGLLSNQYQLVLTNPTPNAATTLEVRVTDDTDRSGDDSREVAACQ